MNDQNIYRNIMDALGWHYLYDERDLVDDSSIFEIENIIGTKLPKDYKEFLRSFGITRFEQDVGISVANNPDKISYEVGVFYGIKQGHSYDLFEVVDAYSSDLPRHILPFASSAIGELCLHLNGDDESPIIWCDPHDSLLEFDAVASSFDEFIHKLKIQKTDSK